MKLPCVTGGRMPVKSLLGLMLPVVLSLATIGLTTLVLLEAYSPSAGLNHWRDPALWLSPIYYRRFSLQYFSAAAPQS